MWLFYIKSAPRHAADAQVNKYNRRGTNQTEEVLSQLHTDLGDGSGWTSFLQADSEIPRHRQTDTEGDRLLSLLKLIEEGDKMAS